MVYSCGVGSGGVASRRGIVCGGGRGVMVQKGRGGGPNMEVRHLWKGWGGGGGGGGTILACTVKYDTYC